MAAGPGTAVVRDTPAAVAGGMRHRGPGRVVVAVADARREPALAALVRDAMARRHGRVVLVANRVRDVEAWTGPGAVCLPESRLGARLVDRGRWPPGALGASFEALALVVGSEL
jgi:hypothetical protein